MPRARRIDDYRGKRVFKVPVMIRCNSSRACATLSEQWIEVIAYSAADAANWVNDRISRPETEVFAYGPAGGKVYRYTGWDSGVWKMMCSARHGAKQLAFKL